jgi:hypothetical protein
VTNFHTRNFSYSARALVSCFSPASFPFLRYAHIFAFFCAVLIRQYLTECIALSEWQVLEICSGAYVPKCATCVARLGRLLAVFAAHTGASYSVTVPSLLGCFRVAGHTSVGPKQNNLYTGLCRFCWRYGYKGCVVNIAR